MKSGPRSAPMWSEQEMWCRRTLLVRVLPDENALARGGLPVDVPLPRVVLEHDRLVADRLHVLGQEWDLPTAPRRVDYKMGHGEPRGPPAQRSDDLQALLDRGAEMLRPRYLVAHVDVVRPHPRGEQFLHQPLHDLRIIVHALQEHRLAAERDARVGETAQRCHRCG